MKGRLTPIQIERKRLTAIQIERFWRKVLKGEPDSCWEWQASTHKQGYGIVGFHGRTYLSHRVAWTLSNGDIPPEMMVCHTCDNPPCCNPHHLFIGASIDNVRDMHQKDRANHPLGDRTGGRVSSKLGWKAAKKIRALYAQGTYTCRSLGMMFAVSGATVSRIVNHILWSDSDSKQRKPA